MLYLYLITMMMCSLFVSVNEIFAVEIFMIFTLTYRMGQVRYASRKLDYLIVIVMFTISFIIYDIFAVEMCLTLTLIFLMGIEQIFKSKATIRLPMVWQ